MFKSSSVPWLGISTLAAALGLMAGPLGAIDWNVAAMPTGGAWNVGGNWVGGVVPDNANPANANFPYLATLNGPRVITLDGTTMYPGGLTSWYVSLDAADASSSVPTAVSSTLNQYNLQVSNLTWNFSTANGGRLYSSENRVEVLNSTLTWDGVSSLAGDGKGNLYMRSGVYSTDGTNPVGGMFFTNSNIIMQNMSTDYDGGTSYGIIVGRRSQRGPTFQMSGGSLIVNQANVTPTTHGAQVVAFGEGINSAGASADARHASPSQVSLNNVTTNVDNMRFSFADVNWVLGAASVQINHRLDMWNSGQAVLDGGTMTIVGETAGGGTVPTANLWITNNKHGDTANGNYNRLEYLRLQNGHILNVSAGGVGVGGSTSPGYSIGGGYYDQGEELQILDSSKLNITGYLQIGEGSGSTGGVQTEIRSAVVLSGATAQVNVSGNTVLGYVGAGQQVYTHDNTPADTARTGGIGRLEISGANAVYTTTNLNVGVFQDPDYQYDLPVVGNGGVDGTYIYGSSGYYNQTGGTATVNGVVNLVTPCINQAGTTYDSRFGTRGFIVGPSATLVLTGAGIVKQVHVVGVGGANQRTEEFNWDARLLNATDLSFAGTLKFAPTVHGTPQGLLSFGVEAGQWAANFSPSNFMVGTIDLTGQDSTDLLTVVGAKNQVVPTPTVNALYVNKFVGLSPADVTSRLDSAQNIYYDPTAAGTSLNTYKVYQLTSGGKVIPKNAGDYNADLALTSADLTTFAANYGSVTPGTAPYDLDGNGTVGNADVNVWFNLLGGPVLLGDMNSDGVVNNQDIAAFVMALTDEPSWQTTYPAPNLLTVGDINGDLAFNNQDIAPFVTLLTGGGTTLSAGELNAIPEPASLGLLAIGSLMLISRRRRA